VKVVELILGFVFFSSIIFLNSLITSQIIIRAKTKRLPKAIVFIMYPFKFLFYVAVIFGIQKFIGITQWFLIGMIISVFIFTLFIFLKQMKLK
jgi:hypothetical protein